jgi:excisionase family DNA binding protein
LNHLKQKNTEIVSLAQRMKRNFLSKKELSEFLGISIFTIDSWVSERREIPFIKMGKRVMFDLSDVLSWIENKKVRPMESHNTGRI